MENVLNSNIKTIFQLLKNRKIEVTELINASIAKAKQLEKYNAFIAIISDNKVQQSLLDSAQRYKLQQPLSELDGIPIAIKDNFCTSMIETTCASQMLEKFRPTYDATLCEKLRNSGAILIGKTNLDQFAMGSGTVDSIFGPTKNHWKYEKDKFFISGGSSGGSAISVATGICLAAIGSDTGGSTRNPASYCGLVGLKPTYGLVSRYGLIPLVNSMDVPGIISRNVDDCVSILNCIAGFDPKDSTSLEKSYRKIRLPPANKLSIQNIKIGIPKEYHCEHLDKEVLDTWNDIATLLGDNGAIVKQISMPHTEYSIVCYSILNQCEVASNMARYDGIEFGLRTHKGSSKDNLFATTRSSGFNEVVLNRILSGNYFLLRRNYEKYFNHALKMRRLIVQDFDNAWQEVQVLLTPTTLTTAPLYEEFVQKTNREQCVLQDYCTQPSNLAGIPAITIPIKLSREGMPIGLQLIGRNLSEPMLLALAKYIEDKVQFKQYTCI